MMLPDFRRSGGGPELLIATQALNTDRNGLIGLRLSSRITRRGTERK